MKKHFVGLFGIWALAGPIIALSTFNAPSSALATTTTYVADTTTQVTASTLVSGAKYLMCQYASASSAYEVLNGTTTSTKQIPFLTPNYSTLAALKSGATSLAGRFVTLTNATGSNWYIRRNSDSYYFASNGSSDLVFASSSTYSDTSRTYFVPLVGGSASYVRFYVYGDSALFLGTKSTGSYFDTWHDQTGSVATKDFILYRVYDQNEEAANYASSFNTSLGTVCSADGSTAIASLRSKWSEESTAWNSLSSAARSVITSATASSDAGASEVAKCKAKYLYIANKYSSDGSINDFMSLRTASLSDSTLLSKDYVPVALLAVFGVLSIGLLGGFFAFSRKHH